MARGAQVTRHVVLREDVYRATPAWWQAQADTYGGALHLTTGTGQGIVVADGVEAAAGPPNPGLAVRR